MNSKDEVGMQMWEALNHAEELGLPREELTLLAWGTGLNWKPQTEPKEENANTHD